MSGAVVGDEDEGKRDVRRVVDRMAVGEIRRVRRVGGLYAPLASCGAAN